jgi:hypothetical protein
MEEADGKNHRDLSELTAVARDWIMPAEDRDMPRVRASSRAAGTQHTFQGLMDDCKNS